MVSFIRPICKMAASFVARSFLRAPRNFIRNAPRKVPKISTERCITLEDLIIYPDQGRLFSSSALLCSDSLEPEVSPAEVKKLMESLTDKFKEARELLDDAVKYRSSQAFGEQGRREQGTNFWSIVQYKRPFILKSYFCVCVCGGVGGGGR